eukprot:TRINITY_DN13914_c0_g1_i3.p2 TRINITY_DN13914_c0_g1~~TRINITY_DN13914_c0_g1_i3.p2  ORF type:complete len:129 (+),score=8.77 TRINITY_DN13914_c0_g1_i3:3-389(+)
MCSNFVFFFSSRRRHTRSCLVSWARRCVQETGVTDGSSSVAKSAWQYRPAINPNSEELGYSAGSFPSRLLLSASYSKTFFDMTTSSVGIVYQRYSPFRYSYTYYGDLNGDGITQNDLVFIPATPCTLR